MDTMNKVIPSTLTSSPRPIVVSEARPQMESPRRANDAARVKTPNRILGNPCLMTRGLYTKSYTYPLNPPTLLGSEMVSVAEPLLFSAACSGAISGFRCFKQNKTSYLFCCCRRMSK